jgi:hypothetical protein
VDAEIARGVGGVMGAVWGTAKGIGAARGAMKVDGARDK